MLKNVPKLGVLVMVFNGIAAAGVEAATLVVGSCGTAKVKYSTIQAAINAAQSGDTITVCPGTYPEQIVVPIPLTIKGIAAGTSNAAVITVPAGGLLPNILMATAGTVAAQVAAQNTYGLALRNITIDGAGGVCVAGVNATAAIALSNMQTADPTFLNTSVQQVVVRNQSGCGATSEGILSENSMVFIDNNSLHTGLGDAVSLNGGTGKITNNFIDGWSWGAATLVNVTNATIQNNVISSAQFGARLDATTGINVWNNTMGPWVGEGVYTTNTTGTWVNNNRISATWAGVFLSGSLGDRVTGNTIMRSQAYGIADTASRGGNQISGNTINESPLGIYDQGATLAGDVITPNTFLNVITTISATP